MTSEAAPKDSLKPDICVVGGGSAGLSVAALAAALGASVVLAGTRRPEGASLHDRSLASGALAAAARRAEEFRRGGAFGLVSSGELQVDLARVRAHVREAVRSAAPLDSMERFRAMGVRVVAAEARFADRSTVMAGEAAVRARRFVVAADSRPAVPAVPGLEDVPYLTGETLLDLETLPERLVVLGGAVAGVELAQACRRLGARVTLVETGPRLLAGEDPEMAAVLERALRAEGIVVRTGVEVLRAERRQGDRVALVLRGGEGEETVEGSRLLIAAGRAPDLDGLALDKAGIEAGPAGIRVDAGLKTTNGRVYAIGEGIAWGGEGSLHATNHQAGLVVRNALFRLPARLGAAPVPRLVLTDPELAAAGATEEEARERHRDIRILRWPFAENDRARAERGTAGHLKAVVTRHGRILGCTIVGPRAGELLAPWLLAMEKDLKVTDLANVVHPHPTLSEIARSAAVEFLKPSAQNPWIRRLVGFVGRLG
ncbi:dihydrolipoyl dehydrogenase family protein [Microvirga thermotolerans]|uniref:dihydrolipoyl dehydrogenase family protein n=1 Tax=Microvirga thermotolerans TaxID=2651334 RepID=UPI001FE27CDE|nr:FAD-dependent oxidoreductase [Microvirga thermotolerans]